MKLFLPLVFCLCILTKTLAQTGSVSGSITSKNGHEPLPLASVSLSDTGRGTISDALGNYTVSDLPAGHYSLAVSFVGYDVIKKTVDIESRKTAVVDVELTPGNLQLADVTVMAEPGKNLTSLSSIDIKLRPVNTSQDVLRMIPGLFIAQHAGGGKAEQIFLRGFDLDHGTDIHLSVDGMPVNMVSHAHGQGYSDLHFIIPETIGSVTFDKGPYYADKGNFATAGFAEFKTRNVLDKNVIKLEGGQFGLARGVVLLNLLPATSRRPHVKQSAYIGSEFAHTNGYFENPQNFKRLNIVAKYTAWWNDRNMISASVSAFTSRWNASGQVPERAVDTGAITRFGSIDPTEGGNTSRINATVKYLHTLPHGGVLENQVYFSRYSFDLYSNFTFFLSDPVNGDQINQREDRKLFGYTGSYSRESSFLGKKLDTYAGASLRRDNIDNVKLSHTVERRHLDDIKWGDVQETNAAAFLSETIELNSKFTISGSVRFDQFIFDYRDKLVPDHRHQQAGLFSPKINFNYALNTHTYLYLKAGRGFHSNDTRVVVAQQGKEILPKATGVDLGTIWKPVDKLVLNVAAWLLDLQQEFVYVGDEGIVEPNGKSRRMGLDLSMRYQINAWLYADGDVNVTRPRSKEGPEGQNYIPLAPTFSSIAGLSFRKTSGWNGSLRYRYLSNRPANEDYSLAAKGYFLVDALVNYTQPKFEIGLSAENIFNRQWKEAQFATTSRLKSEAAPVTEINFTPGSPFFLKARVSYFF
jgi:TonB dependent receptor/CarboxypepD_reg-like domain/TonB-dependent Receptor Plug Domain